eukprot:75439-Amphidinium_carterae.1
MEEVIMLLLGAPECLQAVGKLEVKVEQYNLVADANEIGDYLCIGVQGVRGPILPPCLGEEQGNRLSCNKQYMPYTRTPCLWPGFSPIFAKEPLKCAKKCIPGF